MNKQSAFNEESYEKKVKENEEEKNKELKKELKRKRARERQRAYYHRQKDLKKNEEKKKKKVPKTNAERQREFRQRKAEKSYVDMKRRKLCSNEENDVKDLEAKNLQTSLRGRHRQALLNRTTTRRTSKYEKQMHFLAPFIHSHVKHTNTDIEDQVEEDQVDEDQVDEDQVDDDQVDEDQVDEDQVDEDQVDEDQVDEDQESSDVESEDLSRKTTYSQDRPSAEDSEPDIVRDIKPRSNTTEEDFFSSMMLMTQQLPEDLQLKVQRKIFNIVMDAKEDFLATQSSAYSGVNCDGPGPSSTTAAVSSSPHSSVVNTQQLQTEFDCVIKCEDVDLMEDM